ncbi:unnamed protein product [Urochloa decumbens]|uniref:Uncharacterized protein n=1 Tax=Urochloa decumbens TaxID=240449 RepID=A0ABC8ZFF8_9POAL
MGEPLADYACWKDGQDDLVVEEIGMALTEVMHANAYDNDEEGPELDEDSSDDDDDDPVLSVESDSTDDLVDVDSELAISPTSPSDASESSISKSIDDGSSIHGTPRVSAMKGTRAKQGIVTKLSVSWATDVYDPPVTSDSHTVRGHHRSSRKGHNKYKPSKSSSSRNTSGSKNDKKHSRHSSSSSGGSKKDRKHSHRSTSSGGSSSRTDNSSSHSRKAYSGGGISSSRTVTCVPESAKLSPSVIAESVALPEIVPVLRTMEPIKCPTSCGKDKPFALLSRQFSPARYKGMFSFWSQNQLAS